MLNQIVLQGRLVADPEVRFTNSGVAYSNFTLAVERDFKDQATGERDCDFINCTAWRKTAEILPQYTGKGKRLIISGRLESRKYQTREGDNRTVWEVQVEKVQFIDFLDSGRNEAESPARPPQASTPPVVENDDDLPF